MPLTQSRRQHRQSDWRLGQQEADENRYKPDLELMDRYTAFSAELVRISLLGIAGLGFYLKEFVAPEKKPQMAQAGALLVQWFGVLLGIAGLLLSVAAACGLLHRFYAADGFFHHLKALRREKRGDAPAKVGHEAQLRNRQYSISGGWLVSSECAVVAGIGVLAIAFAARYWVAADRQAALATIGSGSLVSLAVLVAGLAWYKRYRRWKDVAPAA
jgi:hypothetical protein